MSLTASDTRTPSLRRLLKPAEVSALLDEFQMLMPAAPLTIVDVAGKRIAGSTDCLTDEIQLLLKTIPGQKTTHGLMTIYPLKDNNTVMGAIVVQGAVQEVVLNCLFRSLTMLIKGAIEQRAIAQETLERYREINLLYQLGETIGKCLDAEAIPQLVLTEASRVIQSDISLVLLSASATDNTLLIKSYIGDQEAAKTLHQACQPIINNVQDTRHAIIQTDVVIDQLSLACVLCVPLKIQDRIVGKIILARITDKPAFVSSDEKLVTALASQAAIALEKAWLHQQEIVHQRMEEELKIGREIQLSLLPEACPKVPGWEFAAIYQAARLVGGDFYDFFELPDNDHKLGMVIADVTDKGVPAALFMAFSRSIIRAEAMSGHGSAQVLKQANQAIVQENRAGLFLTAFYATLDLTNGRLSYASAGHNWPLLLRTETGEVEELEAQGFVLGAMEDIQVEDREIHVDPGDLVFYFTDGVIEAINADGELFGEERLREVIADQHGVSANQALKNVISSIEAFIQDTPRSDDLTLFVVKRRP